VPRRRRPGTLDTTLGVLRYPAVNARARIRSSVLGFAAGVGAGAGGPHAQPQSGGQADQLLTVADIAGHIGAHEQTVRGWIRGGALKASKFGTRIGYRIRRGDYDAFLRRRQLTGAIARQLLTLGANDLDPAV
jgi:excisionase family DNA binding protein